MWLAPGSTGVFELCAFKNYYSRQKCLFRDTFSPSSRLRELGEKNYPMPGKEENTLPAFAGRVFSFHMVAAKCPKIAALRKKQAICLNTDALRHLLSVIMKPALCRRNGKYHTKVFYEKSEIRYNSTEEDMNTQDILNRISALCKERNWSIAELTSVADLSENTIYQCTTERKNPRCPALKRSVTPLEFLLLCFLPKMHRKEERLPCRSCSLFSMA